MALKLLKLTITSLRLKMIIRFPFTSSAVVSLRVHVALFRISLERANREIESVE